jgi:hypothetical protein
LLGALLGAFVSVVIALPVMYLAHMTPSFARPTIAGAIAGAVVGAVAPGTLIHGVPAALYFVLGLFGAMVGGSDPPTVTPKWLLAAFLFGAVYFLALSLP